MLIYNAPKSQSESSEVVQRIKLHFNRAFFELHVETKRCFYNGEKKTKIVNGISYQTR